MLTAITCNRYHVIVGYLADFYHDLPTLGTPKSDSYEPEPALKVSSHLFYLLVLSATVSSL
jgi:hypothetical protein